MFGTKTENKIFPFFFQTNLEANTAFEYIQFEKEGYKLYVASALTSNHIEDLNKYLSQTLKELRKRFERTDLPILDRMKASIFQSGDYLADILSESNEMMDDVDFNTCFLGFKDDILYVWMDGDLNLRIYRGEDSLLVNQEVQSQFYGSTKIELGDILCVGFNKNIRESVEENVEELVLEQREAEYPSLYIDYQEGLEVLPETEEALTYSTSVAEYSEMTEEPLSEDIEPAYVQQLNRDSDFPAKSKNSFDLKEKLNEIGNSEFLKNLKPKAVVAWNSTKNFALNISEKIVNFIYVTVLRRDKIQQKRFEHSQTKRNLQYLLIAILVIAPVYWFFIRSPKTTTPESKKTVETDNKNNEQIKNNIAAQFSSLQQVYNAEPVSIPTFNTSISTLRQSVQTAKQNNFNDTAYLDSVLTQAKGYENKVLKITEITKVDVFYDFSAIPNAKIVDISFIGKDVYALDQANSQVLKSNGAVLEIIATDSRTSDKKLTSLTQISCSDKMCYLIDEQKGIATLNLTTKEFNNLSGLAKAGEGVKEMIYYPAAKAIYTFIPSTGKVIKYNKTNTGENFTAGTAWNKDAGFGSNITDVAIDGSIMEINSNGVLRRFMSGANDTSFSGLSESTIKLGTRLKVTTTMSPTQTNNSRMYIADSDNSMIAVYEPNFKSATGASPILSFTFKGIYKYAGPNTVPFTNFEEILLSDDGTTLFVLAGGTVYQLTVTPL